MSSSRRGRTSGNRRRRKKLTARQVLDHFEIVSESRPGQYAAICPAHHDGKASLSICDAGDRVLLKCQAGCKTTDVLKAAGLRMADLFIATPGKNGGK